MVAWKIGMVSLGCAKNLVDTEIALGYLGNSGFQVVSDPKDAEVIVINTCGFIESAKQESIAAILEMAEYKKTGRCRALIVCGCLSARYREELTAEIPEIDGLLGIGEMDALPSVINQTLTGAKVTFIRDQFFPYDAPHPARMLTENSGSTYLKIAEGCSHKCAFCAIPQIRGPFRSRDTDALIREAAALADAGIRELNVIAQDTTAFGRDQGKNGTAALLRRLDDEVPVDWIRLLYAYPTGIDDELLTVMAEAKRIVPYLDIPLQHAAASVLRNMKRPGSQHWQLQLLNTIREALPDVVLRSAFIVGFPGETEADFDELLHFLDAARFDRVGIFPFSAEEDTPAFSMQPAVPEEVKQERYARAMALQKEIAAEKNRRYLGRTLPVLIERVSSESELVYEGRHPGQAPEVDGQVYVGRNTQEWVGKIIPVTVTAVYPYDLVGEPKGSGCSA